MIWQTESSLYNQTDFYKAFTKDLKNAHKRVIIESPFITTRRVDYLSPIFKKLIKRGVDVIVNTKPFEEHNMAMQQMSYEGVASLQDVGVSVLMTVGHHRKLAIIDDEISWEGSLNILSQNDSCEIMRRIKSQTAAEQLIKFINLDRFY